MRLLATTLPSLKRIGDSPSSSESATPHRTVSPFTTAPCDADKVDVETFSTLVEPTVQEKTGVKESLSKSEPPLKLHSKVPNLVVFVLEIVTTSGGKGSVFSIRTIGLALRSDINFPSENATSQKNRSFFANSRFSLGCNVAACSP
jgi:hypothetical protein